MPETNQSLQLKLQEIEKRLRVIRSRAMRLGDNLAGSIPADTAEMKRAAGTVHERTDIVLLLISQTEDALTRVENAIGVAVPDKEMANAAGY